MNDKRYGKFKEINSHGELILETLNNNNKKFHSRYHLNILTIDIGNTNIFICLFKKEKPIKFVKIRNTDITKTMLQKHLLIKNSFTNIVISSVVPSISEVVIDFLRAYKIKFYLLKDLIKTLDKINIKNKNKIGEDRIVNAYYAKYFKNLIIIDFGTATTFDAIDSKGNYDGGIIFWYRFIFKSSFRKNRKITTS